MPFIRHLVSDGWWITGQTIPINGGYATKQALINTAGISNMHMLMVIAGGALLLSVFLLFGKLWGSDTAAFALAAKAFIPIWLAISIANLWVGVNHAGYTVRQELPILLIVFLVPAALAGLVIWKQA